nr:acyltransferase [Pseudomonadota bacterium]
MPAPKYFDQLYRQDPNYFNHVEGLRAFAAIWMMFYHMALFAAFFYPQAEYLQLIKHPFFKIALSSSVSLDIFFVISGLVIGHALIKELKYKNSIDPYSFLVRRCARVYPLYLLLIVITLPFFSTTLPNVWTNILQINNILPIAEQHLVWTWSLAVDFQFYALFAAIMWLIAKDVLGKKSCYALTLIFLIMPFVITALLISLHQLHHLSPAAYIPRGPESRLYFSMGFDKLYVRSGPFLYGVLTAYVLIYHRDKLRQSLESIPENIINLFCIITLSLMLLLLANDPIWHVHKAQPLWQTSSYWSILLQRNIFSLLLCAILLLADYPKGIVMRIILKILNLAVWRPFGQLTFSTYLIHPIIILIGFSIFFAHHSAVTAEHYFQFGLWLMLISYLIAIPLYLLVEQPAMHHLKQKLLRLNLIQIKKGSSLE